MDGKPVCDFPGCGEVGTIVSRLSPEGYLVATGKKAYSFREAYRRFHYCSKHHDELMKKTADKLTAECLAVYNGEFVQGLTLHDSAARCLCMF